MKTNTIWKFTNQRELNKSEFITYIEKKVFKTIRTNNLLPKDKIFKIKKSNDLNTKVLTHILQKKFQVKLIPNTKYQIPNTSTANLSQCSENIFKQIIEGNFKNLQNKTKAPLLLVSDKEIELYAKLQNIKGTKRKQNKQIQSLFQKFLTKNQDLEINILKSANQINPNR